MLRHIRNGGMTGRLRIVGPFAFTVFLMTCSSVFAQVSDVCQDSADRPFRNCLTEIGRYTAWMVVPGAEVVPGELQQAIDDTYKALQQEWTGPLRLRTHVKLLYYIPPALLLLYLLAIFAISHYLPPSFVATGNPRWTTEKVVIIGGALAIILALAVERTLSYQRMSTQYDVVSAVVTRFVHLRSPAELARATTNPCDAFFKDNDLLSAMCKEDWAQQARISLAPLLRSKFVDQALIRDAVSIGKVCSNAGPPPAWWDSPSADPGEKAMKMDCAIFQGGQSSVRTKDLAPLSDLRKWLTSSDASAVLKVEDAFSVQTVGGGLSVYREKVRALIGADIYREYKSEFQRTSFRLFGLYAVAFVLSAGFLYYSRHQELVVGSGAWGKGRRIGLLASVLIATVVTLIGVLAVVFS